MMPVFCAEVYPNRRCSSWPWPLLAGLLPKL